MEKILAEINKVIGTAHTWVEKGMECNDYQDEAVVQMDVVHDFHPNDERRRADSHFHGKFPYQSEKEDTYIMSHSRHRLLQLLREQSAYSGPLCNHT